MTTDKTPATLATVMHGGCVQLGDGLPPLPCTNYNAYSDGTEPLFNAQQMREYARAALSAQASPGGQDALLQDYDKLLAAFNRQVETAEKFAGRVLQQDDRIEELEEALAARQPVPATVKDSLTVGGGEAVGND